MRTTMQVKHKPALIHIKDEASFGFTPLPKRLLKVIKNAGKPIVFGKQSYGQGENTLTDHRSQIRIDNCRLQGKHPACKTCPGCGKGKQCPIL